MRKDKTNISDKLKLEKKINEEFEVMLSGLTLEELIGLKIEVSARRLKGKLYGIDLYNAMAKIAKAAAFDYAYNFCRSDESAASLLGMNLHTFNLLRTKYNKKKREQVDGEL
jgi:hypothetical protein